MTGLASRVRLGGRDGGDSSNGDGSDGGDGKGSRGGDLAGGGIRLHMCYSLNRPVGARYDRSD